MDSSNSENASSRTNMFEDTPDSVFSDLAQSYNKPGSTGHFRAEYAQNAAQTGGQSYNETPLFTQEQIDAGRTSTYLTPTQYYTKLKNSITYDYDRSSGQLTFKAPKSIAETPQWQGYVNSVNTALRNQPLEQAINYLGSDEANKAYNDAVNNAVTTVQQHDTLAASLGQTISQDNAAYFGGSSTLSDGEGHVRDGAYMYIPVVQPDGSITYERKSADEAMTVKNIANVVPGFILNSQEYIDSTRGEYTATGLGVGQAAGAATGNPLLAVGGAALGGAIGYFLGDDDGHMEKRYSEVKKLVDEKGDTNIMDLTQDEKAELYAAVSEAAGRLQTWADKGIELSDDMKNYYSNLVGLQYSLGQLGFNRMSNLTTVKNYAENFARQTANNLFGGSTTLGVLGGIESAIGGEGFGTGFSETQSALTAAGTDTYASPAEQLFAPRNDEGIIGDRGVLGVAADVVLGIMLDPAGKVADSVNKAVTGGTMNRVVGGALKGASSVIDDGGISILAAGMGTVNRNIRNWAGNRASREAVETAVSGAAAGGHTVVKDMARQVADATETQVDDGLEATVNKVTSAVSEAGDDEVRQTIKAVADTGEEVGEQTIGDAVEKLGKNLSMDDVERAAGEAATDGTRISDTIVNAASRVYNNALDNLAKGITAVYDGFARLGDTTKLQGLLDAVNKSSGSDDKEAVLRAYRQAVASGAVRQAIGLVAKQIPLNALVALGNTAISQETARSMGQKFDSEDYWNTLLGNFGVAMITSAAPAGLRAGSQVLDAFTNNGVTKVREKANQYATKLATIPGTILRNAPGIKTVREKMQQFANPDARQLNELRYRNNLARGKGLISYDEWVANIDKLSEAQVSTQAMETASRLGAKDLFAADNRVMNMMGALKVSGKPKRGDAYTTARKLLNDFIIYDDMAYRLSPDAKAAADLTKADLETRANNRAEYLKRRDEALEQMEKLVEDNGGDVNEFRTALYGSRLDTDVDTTQGPVRAAADDQSFRGRIRTFYDARSQLMADKGITSQSSLDALRTNPAYAGTYIRLAYLEGKSVDEIAENVAQFYVVTNKPKTSAIVQSVKNELGLDDSRELAGVAELAVRSIYDVSDAILANDRNKIAVSLSDALGDADMSFCKLSGDPDVIDQGEAAIQSYKDFQANAQATFDEQIAYDPNVDKRRRTDRDSANLNEYHQKLTNTDYIQQQAAEAGVTPEAMARSYMAATEQQMVDSYRKLERARFGNEKGDKLARRYKKKLDAWLSGEDLTQSEVRQRRQQRQEISKQRDVYTRLSDDALNTVASEKNLDPVSRTLVNQERARRRSQQQAEGMLQEDEQTGVSFAKEFPGSSKEFIESDADSIFNSAQDAQREQRWREFLGRDASQPDERAQGEQLTLADGAISNAQNFLPEGYNQWHDTFVAENGVEPTRDDVLQQVTMELQGKRQPQLTNERVRGAYDSIVARENASGLTAKNYIENHRRELHLGKGTNTEKAQQIMSFIPENGLQLAMEKEAPTLAQTKSAAIYTGQTTKGTMSSDVIEALRRRATKQTVTSQNRAIDSFMADDAIVDTDGSFVAELNPVNQANYMRNLSERTKNAVESVGGKYEPPQAGTSLQEQAAFLGKQLQRARLVQEIQTNPQKYSKQEFSLARDDDGNPIPGSGKYLTSPERLVIRSKPTDRFDTFNKFNQGIYKTLDQRNSQFNPTDEVYVGTGQVLAANDSEALDKIVRSMKRTFTDPATRQQISTFESRLNNLTGNSLDDLPLVQELLNSVYGVDAVRFTGKQGDTVLVLDGSSAKNGGIWEEKTTFDQIDAQTLHDYDTTADLWKDNVKSKQSDTKARINAEKASIKEGAKKPNFAVYRGGKRYTYEITNPVVARAFQTVSMSTTKTTMDVLTRFGQRAARGFRSGTTGPLNPAYMFSNYVRDLQTASITAGIDTILPKYADDLYTSIFEAAGVPTADSEDIARRLRDGYGNSSYSMSAQGILRHSPAQQRKILYREMKKATGSKKGIRRVTSFDDLINLMEKPSDWIEQNRRGRVAASYYNRYIREHLAEYLADGSDAARKNLIDNAINYATFAGRNATTDFSYRTQYASDFLSLIPYSRTALSSARSFGRMFLADPIGMTSRILMYGVAPYIANLISNVSDDDKAATYAEIPEWERADNWIVVTGDGSYISVPIPQELAAFVSPARTLVENANDIRNSGALAALGGGLSNYSPIDFSGFFERDINGDIDWVKAAGRMANSLLPQAVSPAVETILNRDLYTSSPLHPTVEDLVRQGAKLNKDGTVDMSAMTYASRNSQTLGEIADFIGIPQGDVYNLVTGYTGTFGRYLINAVDTFRGAPSGSVGGQAPTDYAAQAFFNTNPTGASSAWNQGLSDLYDRKDNLIEVMDSQNYSDDEKDEYIRDYVDSVKRFCDTYADYYSIAGGLSDRQRNQVVGLLNFYKGAGSLESTSDALSDAGYDEYNAALQRAVDIGVMPSGGLQSDLYGTMNDEGEVTYNTPAMRAFQNRVFGTPEQATREMTAVLDDNSNGGTMKELKSAVYDALDPYYERIAAGEQLTDEEYDEMDAIRKSYMDEFYRRIDPIIEKYGATILNNDNIIEALNDYTITTSDDWQESIPQYSKRGKEYHRYISSKLFPNATADVQQILLEHYGMGGRDTSSLQSDQRATDLIQALQQATANGEMGKAQDYQRVLFTGIQNGSIYVSDKDMSQLQI